MPDLLKQAKKYGVWLEVGLIALSSALLVKWGLGLVGNFQIDDAYITFDYSKNVAEGRGPIYGFDHKVEGYSNFLWMMLVAIGEVFGRHAMTTARLLSHLFFALTLGSTWIVARRWGGSLPTALLVLCLAASSDFHVAIQSGLETVAFTGFITAGLAHYVLEPAERRRFSLLWFAGAALTRIDGFVPLLTVAGLEVVRVFYSKERPRWKEGAIWFSLGTAMPVLYWAWRASYYGLPLPLTFYAKASMAINVEHRGADYVFTGLRDMGLWIAVLGAAVGAFDRRTKQLSLLVFAYVAVQIAYVAHVGGDWMPFNRMLLPIVPALFMVCSAGMGRILVELDAGGIKARLPASLVMLTGVCVMALHMNRATLETAQEEGKLSHAAHITDHTGNLLQALPFIQAMVRAPGERLVTDYGGVFAYGTEASVIEMWGLANRDIALHGNTDGINPIYGKTCVACYAEFKPDYFHSMVPLLRDDRAFVRQSSLIGQIFQGHAIGKVVGFRENYLMGRVRKPSTGQTLWFLERKREGVHFDERKVGPFVIDYPEPVKGHRRGGRPPHRTNAPD